MRKENHASRKSEVLNLTAEYALRAVIFLAERHDESPVRVGDIASELDVPRNYLSKVLHVLARDGILHSTRGPLGGFTLARHADDLFLADVISPFDPIHDRCLLVRRKCSDIEPCVAHHRWKDVATRLRAFFRETSIGTLVRSARAAGRRSSDVLLSSLHQP
jgi:Rrf2 family transcriptional regulator, iron-sulfur cluster assembly transcription factor